MILIILFLGPRPHRAVSFRRRRSLSRIISFISASGRISIVGAGRLPCLHCNDERPERNSTKSSKKFCLFRCLAVATDRLSGLTNWSNFTFDDYVDIN